MRIQGYRCDTCEKEYLFRPSLIFQNTGDILPDNWFLIRQGTKDMKEPWLFCSVACVRAYPFPSEESHDAKNKNEV